MLNIQITDPFWLRYMALIKEKMIPYQWEIMNDRADIKIEKENSGNSPSGKSHAIENFKIAAKLTQGEHYGWWFQDTDVYKWIESVANTLRFYPDPELEKLVDGVIDLIEKAQDDDGYLNTYYQIRSPELKFKRLHESHEMYCAGHLIEAAVAYFEATQKDQLLKIACKFADCIDHYFGPEESKIHGADGHQEIELALVKLYLTTGQKKYLKLSDYLLTIRGENPNFYQEQLGENSQITVDTKYLQGYAQPIHQTTAEGHAVRLVYMCKGMADVAYHTGNPELLEACKKIWRNMVSKRMYVTGGIGSTVHGEAFTGDYDLPNDTMYCETCAAIGLMNFAHSMLQNEQRSEYADILERALYNNVLAGMSLDGKNYFYVNPLESHPDSNKGNPGKSHVKSTRPAWFGCACCPPNLARTISKIDQYIYTETEHAIFTHLYLNHVLQNDDMTIEQIVDDTMIKIIVQTDNPVSKTLYFRIPNWADYMINYPIENGYIKIEKTWVGTQIIDFNFKQPVLKISAHPKVRADIGKVAIQKGPFIYCMEEKDNGVNLHLNYLSPNAKFGVKTSPELGDIQTLEATGVQLDIKNSWSNDLYRYNVENNYSPKKLVLIPYYAWANRGACEMQVWINEK